MATVIDALDPIEVNDFKFLELRKLNLLSSCDGVPPDPINIVATSSRYGLIFVGVVGGFRVLKLENILDLDEDKDNFRHPAENYSTHVVHSATPTLIALSSDDMTLAVCSHKDDRAVADMYDVRAFADTENMPLPFLTVQLSSHPAQLRDFMWNPVVVEKYAYCLSDGSLHVHEIVDTTLNIVAGVPAQTGATAVCWSPKGKQLVVGKKDGSFSQYKPNLQEVKKVNGPKIDNSDVEVLNICWLTTTLFAVVYLPRFNDALPYVVLVSTPKGVEITYISFGDVCLGSGSGRQHRYLMHYQQEWGVLICASSNSVETAVIGGLKEADKTNWAQWFLEGEGRADMPYDKKKETYPVGMSVIFCAQRKIIKSETESFPPMPIIFMLATSGILCPFHVLTTKPGCPSNVYPSEPIYVEGERKPKISENAAPAPASNSMPFKTPLMPGSTNNQQPSNVSAVPKQKASFFGAPPVFTNTEPKPLSFFGKGDTPGSLLSAPKTQTAFTPLQQNQGMAPSMFPPGSVRPGDAPSSFAFQPTPRPLFPSRPIPPAPSFAVPQSEPPPPLPQAPSFASSPPVLQPQVPSFVSPPSMQPFQPPPVAPTVLTPAAASMPTVRNIQPQSVPVPAPAEIMKAPTEAPATSSQPAEPKALPITPKNDNSSSIKDDAYSTLIFEEVCKFEEELMRLKESNRRTLYIGTKEEMAFIRKNSLLFEDFHKDLSDTMQSLNLDTHNLKTASLECFAMLGEATSRNLRRSDPKYRSMLRDRPLDPMTAKRNQKIKQLYQYLGTQLQEVHDKLDRDRVEYAEKQKKKYKNQLRIPSSQAVYLTLVNNQNIIYNLKSRLDNLTKNYSQMKHINAAKKQLMDFTNLSGESELEKLAGVLLDNKLPEDKEAKKCHGRQKLTSEIQAALREALLNHRITCVRPKVIRDPSESQLLSSSILHTKSRKLPSETATPVTVSQPVPSVTSFPVASVAQPETAIAVNKTVVATPSLDVKPLSAFTMKPGQQRMGGGITQGTPVVRFVTPPSNENMPSRPFAQVVVSSGQQRPARVVPIVLGKQDQNKGDLKPVQLPLTKPVYLQMNPNGAPQIGYGIGKNVGSVPNNNAPIIKFVPGIVTTNMSPENIIRHMAESARNDFGTAKPVYDDISPPASPNPSSEDVFAEEPTSPSYSSATPLTSPSHSPTVSGSFVAKSPQEAVPPSAGDVASSQTVRPVASTSVLPASGFLFGSSLSGQKQSSTATAQPTTVFTVTTSKDGTAVVQKQTSVQAEANEGNQNAVPSTAVFGQPGASFSFNSSFTKPNLSSFSFAPKPAEKLDHAPSSTTTAEPSIPQSPLAEQPETTSVLTPDETVAAAVEEAIDSLALDSTVIEAPLSPISPTPAEAFQPVVSPTADGQKVLSEPDSTTPTANGAVSPPSSTVPASTTKSIFGSSSLFGSKSVAPFGGVSNASTSSATTTPSFFTKNTTTQGSFFGSVPGFGTATASSTAVTTASPVLAQTVSTTSSFLTQPPSTQSSFFSKPAAVFGQASSQVAAATTTTATTASSESSQPATSVFGQPSSPVTTTTSSAFTQSGSSIFGQATSPETTTVSSTFGQSPASIFGQATVTTSSSFNQSATSVFGQAATPATTTTSSAFNQSATTSPFGQAASTSPFTSNAAAPFSQSASPFGQGSNAAGSAFGQTANTGGPFGQTTSSFFNQTNQTATSAFGQKPNQAGGSIFGGQSSASGFSFGKSTFGQTSSNTFGLAKAVFGDSGNQQSGFGQSSEQQNMFGQSSFFSGLGGKPNEQNASKNVFGSVTGNQQAPSTNLFGNQGASSFGAKPSGFQSGSFSNPGGSVAQSGFGAFQQTSPKPGGFGAAPAFGSPPAFGGSPGFGSSPTFGGGPAPAVMGSSSPFGGTAQASFSNFAAADAPTFGSLASQSGTFGSQQSPGFGQQSQAMSVFGGGAGGSLFGGGGGGGSSTFGSQQPQQQPQQSGFGSPPSGGSSAFTQWRN